jgi:hypothetical protein
MHSERSATVGELRKERRFKELLRRVGLPD